MITMHKKYDHWTDSFRINQSFVADLMNVIGNRPFTNWDAYRLYLSFHASKRNVRMWNHILEGYREAFAAKNDIDPHYLRFLESQALNGDQWMQMNVRNQLCKLHHMGRLIRTSPGHYIWSH